MAKPCCSSEPTCSSNSLEENLINIISEYSFVELRERQVSDLDFERLKQLHDRITTLCSNDTDENRKTRYLKLVPFANCIRDKILLLRKHQTNPYEEPFYTMYLAEINNAFVRIVDDSFADEYRKIEINLGLVNAIAELLVVEVDVFGCDVPRHSNARTIRKSIGNALTNLTYGNMQCKQRLCQYPKFLDTVVDIIYNVPNLTQVYAALIRNLSWLADPTMGDNLAPLVPVLVKAAIRASQPFDEKSLLATLSALWNLASHSEENQRIMCESPEFLSLLISLFSVDQRFIVLIESASGIMKYISDYIAKNSELLKGAHEKNIIRELLKLLQTSSFTVLANSLNALKCFAAMDKTTQKKLLQDPIAMALLHNLKNSNRDEIRSSARLVLNYLHSVSYAPSYAFTLPSASRAQNEASVMNYDTSSLYRRNRNDRLLSHRQPFYPNMHYSQLKDLKSPTFSTQSTSLATTNDMISFQPASMPSSNILIQEVKSQQIYHTTASYSINGLPNEYSDEAVKFRSSSLPRCNILSPAKSIIRDHSEQPNKEGDKILATNINEYESEFINEPVLEAGNNVSDSMLCTRSASIQSLTSVDIHNASGWESRISTHDNSNNISPGSLSDIPASPSECMGIRSAKLDSPNLSIEGTKDDDVIYSHALNTNEIDEALLSNVIASVIPKPSSPRNTDSSNSTLKRDRRNLSSAGTTKQSNYDEEKDQFLLESIASVLPSPHKDSTSAQKLVPVKPSLIMKTNGGFAPKPVNLANKFLGQNGLTTKDALLQYKDKHNEEAKHVEQNKLANSKEAALHEDNYNRTSGSSGSIVDGGLPIDVDFELQSESLFIDCLKVNTSATRLTKLGDAPLSSTKRKIPEAKERHSRSRICPPKNLEKMKPSSIPKSSPVTNPITNSSTTVSSAYTKRSPYSNKMREKPIVPPKPSVSQTKCSAPTKKTAQVSPLNYKRPEMSRSTETSEIQTNNGSSKQQNEKKIGKLLVSAV